MLKFTQRQAVLHSIGLYRNKLCPPSSFSLVKKRFSSHSSMDTSSLFTSMKFEYILNGSILWPSNLFERFLEVIHLGAGLPWYSTIIIYTISLRVLLFPINVKQMKSTITAQNYKPQISALQSESQALKSLGKHEEAMKKIKELSILISEKGINPIKILGMGLFPVPFFMSTFFALRNMSDQPISSFITEGCLWFNDLSVPDPYYILPILSSSSMLISMEINQRISPNQSLSPAFKNALRALTAISVPVTSFMPSALVLYFVTTNLITSLISLMWSINPIRNFFKIPNVKKNIAVANPSKAKFWESFKDAYQANVNKIEHEKKKEKIAKVSKKPLKKLYSKKPSRFEKAKNIN